MKPNTANSRVHLPGGSVTALARMPMKMNHRLMPPGPRRTSPAGDANVMTATSSGVSKTSRVVALLIMLTMVGAVSIHAGCCIIGAAAVHERELDKDRRTRAGVASLQELQPGGLVTIKQPDTLAVTGRFLGLSKPVSEPPVATEPPGNQMVLLRVGSQPRAIPLVRVEWVQRKSSPHVILIGFGIGLAIDATVIYLIGQSLSGYGTIG
jgi:hypothetical protein